MYRLEIEGTREVGPSHDSRVEFETDLRDKASKLVEGLVKDLDDGEGNHGIVRAELVTETLGTVNLIPVADAD